MEQFLLYNTWKWIYKIYVLMTQIKLCKQNVRNWSELYLKWDCIDFQIKRISSYKSIFDWLPRVLYFMEHTIWVL